MNPITKTHKQEDSNNQERVDKIISLLDADSLWTGIGLNEKKAELLELLQARNLQVKREMAEEVINNIKRFLVEIDTASPELGKDAQLHLEYKLAFEHIIEMLQTLYNIQNNDK